MAVALNPVPGSQRNTAIDAARGFALLGILLVNIQSFGEPFGEFIKHRPDDASPWSEVAAFYFVKVFCESKFYPLFAMLFGYGLMTQAARAAARGRAYWAPGIRRYLFLGLLGLAHALLLWYGDILFVYAGCGLILLVLHRVATRALAVTGAVILGVSVLLMTVFSLVSAPPETSVTTEPAAEVTVSAPDGTDQPPPEDKHQPAPETPVIRLLKAMETGEPIAGPADPRWMALEREAYTSGGAADRLAFNAFTWCVFLVVCLVGFGWHVLAMMLFGAVLARLGVFEESRSLWHSRVLKLALFVALPVCILGATAGQFLPTGPAGAVFSATSMIFGPVLSLGYVAAIVIAVRRGIHARLIGALANVGRMALSNYLFQTLVATTVFYQWGLGLFDQTTRVQRLGMVVAIFAVQLVISSLWLRVFRHGPMEWVWRTVTYLRFPTGDAPPGRGE